jgi:hypothetical protein
MSRNYAFTDILQSARTSHGWMDGWMDGCSITYSVEQRPTEPESTIDGDIEYSTAENSIEHDSCTGISSVAGSTTSCAQRNKSLEHAVAKEIAKILARISLGDDLLSRRDTGGG